MYTFTTQFSGSCLHQRVGMINNKRSGWRALWRYALLFLIVYSVTIACQINVKKHKYIYQSGNSLYSVITAKTSDRDLDTLRYVLNQRNIDLNIKKLVRLANGQINQLALTINVPKPGHPIDTEIGSSLGKSSIPAIGLRCDESGCQLNSVTDKFPGKLIDIAKRETKMVSPELQRVSNKYSDANALFGMYRVFFRNDFLESNYFGYRQTAIRMTPDYHLDLYPEYQNAVVFIDGQEVNRGALGNFHALDLKKVVVFNGDAAIIRLGHSRAKNGLILLYTLKPDIRDRYASTYILRNAYPELFSEP